MPAATPPPTLRSWVLACGVAEAIGIGTAGLAAVLAESATASAALALVLVAGAVEGLALGTLQWRWLRTRLPSLAARDWVGLTVAVAVVGWALGTAAVAAGDPGGDPSPGPPGWAMALLGLPLGAAAGGLFGAAQWFILRHHARDARRWVAANVGGWALAFAGIFGAAGLPTPDTPAALVVLAAAAGGFFGGLGLGAVTGRVATRLVPWVDPSWDLEARTAVVTGATSGIGHQVALALAGLGATVVLPVRDADRGDRAVAAIRAASGNPDVHWVLCDLADLESVRIAASRLRTRWHTIDLLVHDAGAYTPDRQETPEGVEHMFAVCVLGPWLLTSLLKPALASADDARIVQLAGRSHERGVLDLADLQWRDRPWDPQAASRAVQLARVVLVRAWSRLLAPAGVAVNAVHPGAVLTAAQDVLPAPLRLLLHTVLRPGFVRPALGALPVVRLAADPALADVTGRVFGRFHEHALVPGAADEALAEQLWAALEALEAQPVVLRSQQG